MAWVMISLVMLGHEGSQAFEPPAAAFFPFLARALEAGAGTAVVEAAGAAGVTSDMIRKVFKPIKQKTKKWGGGSKSDPCHL